MEIAVRGKRVIGGAGMVAGAALLWAMLPAPPNVEAARPAVLHGTVSISGGLTFTGSFDDRLNVATCADAAKTGTGKDGLGKPMFLVPSPAQTPDGNPGPVGGGHTFETDAAAEPYHGPGTYTGTGITATQLEADMPPGSQDKGIFAFPTGIGTLTINPDASGSFQFQGLQDPGSVTISGQVTWTCS